MKFFALFTAALVLTPAFATAQSSDGHGQMSDNMHVGMDYEAMKMPLPAGSGLTEGEQSAFAAIQEVVSALLTEPATDWTNVNIEALRQHLIDMDNVTLHAKVVTEEIDGGAQFVVTSDNPAVEASIRTMTRAHAATMDGVEGWRLDALEIPDGAELIATGDAAKIRALGFIGLMTVGAHHQAHHMALALGQTPHSR